MGRLKNKQTQKQRGPQTGGALVLLKTHFKIEKIFYNNLKISHNSLPKWNGNFFILQVSDILLKCSCKTHTKIVLLVTNLQKLEDYEDWKLISATLKKEINMNRQIDSAYNSITLYMRLRGFGGYFICGLWDVGSIG